MHVVHSLSNVDIPYNNTIFTWKKGDSEFKNATQIKIFLKIINTGINPTS